MQANEIITTSFISQIGIKDNDKSLDGTKTFADIKASVARAINVINEALPKMKAAGIDMKKAADEAEQLFRNIVRKGWGGNEVEFYINDGKAITAVTARTIDDIVATVKKYILNYR